MTQPKVILSQANVHIDGEYTLCMKIADSVFVDREAGIKSIKTKLFFSNEYYSCKDRYIFYTHNSR